MPVPYNKNTSTANVVLIDPTTLEPYAAGGAGAATGPGTAAAATRVTFASDAPPVGITYPALPASTDRSGTATTTSGVLNVAANANRKSLTGQNIGANNIGFNEQGGTAAIGTAGTYTVAPGASFSISTNKLINFIAATGNTAVTMTET